METRVLGEGPQRHRENIQTPPRKKPATSSCEASELVTQLLCLPSDYLLVHPSCLLVYIKTFRGLIGCHTKSKWNFYTVKLLQLLRPGSIQRVPARRESISPGLMLNGPPPCLPLSQSILPFFCPATSILTWWRAGKHVFISGGQEVKENTPTTISKTRVGGRDQVPVFA